MSKRACSLACFFALLTTLLLGAGCASYRIGSMLPDDVSTVAVPSFTNESGEPLIEIETTRATVAQLQRDGSLRVMPMGEADAVLRVTITGFDLRAIDFDDQRTRRVDEYRMTLTADVVLLRASNEEVIAQRSGVTGKSEFPIQGDLTSAKRTALPDAAEDLARQIVDAVVEVW